MTIKLIHYDDGPQRIDPPSSSWKEIMATEPGVFKLRFTFDKLVEEVTVAAYAEKEALPVNEPMRISCSQSRQIAESYEADPIATEATIFGMLDRSDHEGICTDLVNF